MSRLGPIFGAIAAGSQSLQGDRARKKAERAAEEAARVAAEDRARKRTLEDALALRQTAMHDREMREGGYVPEVEAQGDGRHKVEGRQLEAMLGALSPAGAAPVGMKLDDLVTPERYGQSVGGYKYDKQSRKAQETRAPRNIDPLSQEGIKAAAERARALASATPEKPAEAPDFKPLLAQFNSDPIVKNSAAVVEAYKKVRGAAANPSPAGDMSLVFGYMKMQDPNSSVREGEYANAQNAASVPDRVRNAYNKALAGEMLNPAQRQDFLNQARLIAQSQRELAKAVRDRYAGIATRNGIDPRNVVFDPFEGVLDAPPTDPAQWLRSRRGQP